MTNSTIEHCQLIEIDQIGDRRGHISVVENNKEVPFEVKRIYYLYDVPSGEERGGHAHKDLEQLIIAVSGSFDVIVGDGETEKTFSLSRPNKGLYFTSGLWRKINNFSSGAICLVLASHEYDEKDYIRNYNEFLSYKK
jgi:oxalate decarboxylase/phosphoglucose isomerase-like protein (cupin superfamily)